MHYQVLNQDADLSLIERLLKVRNISDIATNFLNPTLWNYWLDPFLLNDMDKWVERIIKALKNKEKIIIFWDYDVDGITASYTLYKFFSKYLNYHNVSIRYPHRIEDGYGLKTKHLDIMKDEGISLVITVDNGITSIAEAEYAKTLGMDLIITDHHQALDELPDAYAVINPQVSSRYPFKGLAWVGVAFKLLNALLAKSTFTKDKKNEIFNYFLPIVAIGTVADIVPLIHENRVIVKRGLEIMNCHPEMVPKGLQGFLNFLNLKGNIDTFHIGFVIGPRINAGGRLESPYDSLKILLCESEDQEKYIQKIEDINSERRRMQDQAFRIAEKQLDLDQCFLSVCDEEFHEGIVGIVAWRITEKYNKPSAVFKIDKEKHQAIASLRGPEYFNVIEMISKASPYLKRFWGHKWAWGLTIDLDDLEKVITIFQKHCNECIKEEQLEKITMVDTILHSHEWNYEELSDIEMLAPFWEGNQEPLFLLENVNVVKAEKVWKNWWAHLKLYGKFWDNELSCIFWSKGDEIDKVWERIRVIGNVKKDTFNGGFYVHWLEWENCE